jgi:Reverse transcriptase (RNA-dependent DNA polymerase)
MRLSSSGFGCFTGMIFISSLAYADDIVLIAPTPNATRKVLTICDDFAAQYDMSFNADKSKFLVIIPHKRQFVHTNGSLCMRKCSSLIND